MSRIEPAKERADKIIEKAYELVEFRDKYKEFQVVSSHLPISIASTASASETSQPRIISGGLTI